MDAGENGAEIARSFGAPVLAVCGFSGSGKTTLLEAAIPRLVARGLAVAVVKHDAHGFVVDREGKDSDRLFRAGATVALRGPSEQFLRRGAGAALTLAATLEDLARDHDLVLVEGHKETPLPKLWMASAETPAPPEEVTGVREVFPWNGPRLERFLELLDRWLPEAWRARPLHAGLLVGGKSSRMGSPKQLLRFGESSLGEIVAQALNDGLNSAGDGPRCADAWNPHLAVLGAGELPHPLQELTRLPDIAGVSGPLVGLLAAHRWAPQSAWILAACDHPRVRSADIRALMEQRQPGRWAILSRQPDGHPCPTLALYEPQALRLLERSLLERGANPPRLAELIDHPRTWVSPQISDGTIDVNTPLDLQAEKMRSE
jgi:molybdopterin-guanine dinucleotide biosynthesis protein MobB